MKPLTWYPGTILPYTSMWHTLLRATWLNDLRSGDIRQLYMSKASTGKDCAVREAKILALALGESRQALSKFAMLEQFPPAVSRSCMVAQLRWCPACIASGFHTLLGNIRLISRCPIHAQPLIEECPKCHEKFKMRLTGLTIVQRQCRCGYTKFVTAQEARQPSMQVAETAAWIPVAQWVKHLDCVRYSPSFERLLPAHIQLALTARWCHDNAINYPACFDAEPVFWRDAGEAKCWSVYRAASGCLQEVKPVIKQNVEPTWPESDQCTVYKSMGRHLRRHGLANPDRLIKILMRTFDPAAFAKTMAKRAKARVAFAEMLWTRQLEPRAITRRWPNRPAEQALDFATPSMQKTRIELLDSVGSTFIPGGLSITGPALRWVIQHATALEARQAWARAIRQTDRSIAQGWADWVINDESNGSSAFADCVVWFCRPKGKCTEFVGYIRNAGTTRFTPGMTMKQQRCEAWANARHECKNRLDDLAEALCLNWSQHDGWQVENGAHPSDEDVREVALLHTGQPTHCWIFKSGDLFVARVVNGLVQAKGPTARDALCGLRRAVIHYRQTYDANHAKRMANPEVMQTVPPTLIGATRCAQWHVMQARGQGTERFWSTSLIAREMGMWGIAESKANGEEVCGLPPMQTEVIKMFDAQALKLDVSSWHRTRGTRTPKQ
ncbi:hypothetical protein [Rhodoferax sp. U11-2br]|uniref:hypothetical protein n=1 Tax=Rhodoferax sp. U11-2br TaxID=2838878 RepID=UPI001BE9AADF|nr:hypothetical protein [Rhodoferax sp. U11-2br]MBT3066623.1 hypothetical protein [Rhodoferax sp. U11-2br]